MDPKALKSWTLDRWDMLQRLFETDPIRLDAMLNTIVIQCKWACQTSPKQVA